MKRFLIILILLIIIFFAFSPFLPQKFINIDSNVPLKAQDIFKGFDGFYFTYFTKIPVVLHRKLLQVDVSYEENVIYNIKFADSIFGITKNGYIINKTLNDGPLITANFEKEKWTDNFSNFFLILMNYNYLNQVKSLEIYEKNIAFFDKKDILIIMSNDNLEGNLEEYLKVLQVFSKKIEEIQSIDLRYNNQAIIIWRER